MSSHFLLIFLYLMFPRTNLDATRQNSNSADEGCFFRSDSDLEVPRDDERDMRTEEESDDVSDGVCEQEENCSVRSLARRISSYSLARMWREGRTAVSEGEQGLYPELYSVSRRNDNLRIGPAMNVSDIERRPLELR